RAAVLAVVCLVLFRFVLRPVRAEGPSMEPTVRNGSLHLVYSLAYLGQAPRRGDLVTIRGVTGSLMYMKRVLAVPGDRVAFRRGALYLNG
ncbi:MAG: signal peptidase I, partial [Gammaproteobacteria bacterium]|nr:signal peptidase I [Gemmatimonadota bacterium]NIR37930.1 signal peptidase I [Actinomycetota bacterium]NIU77713.1 signal peptidase I [Gammaproteobacteria bacterium]